MYIVFKLGLTYHSLTQTVFELELSYCVNFCHVTISPIPGVVKYQGIHSTHSDPGGNSDIKTHNSISSDPREMQAFLTMTL